MEDKSCKTPRWRLLKAQLNNLKPGLFEQAIKEAGNQAFIIDVRTPAEYRSGHLPGACNFDYLSDDLWDRVEALSTQKTFFVYCRTGRRSIRVCTLMKNGGFDAAKIFNLEGGIAQWMEEKRMITSE